MAKGFRVKMVKRSSAELNQILAQIMTENGVESWEYSLEGFEDERQCLEMQDGKWQVYFAERGQKRRCKSFDDHKEAAHELLRRLGRTESQRASMVKAMDEKWQEMKFTPICAKDDLRYVELLIKPVAAKPVFFVSDTKRAGKIAKTLPITAWLGVKDAPKGMIDKVAMKAFAQEAQRKEKATKELKRIETFGFKG